MLYADKKDDKTQKTPAGRINTPDDGISKSFEPPSLFGEEEELMGTEKVQADAEKKKQKKGL